MPTQNPPSQTPPTIDPSTLEQWQSRLDTRFPQIQDIFPTCALRAHQNLSTQGFDAYLEYAKQLGKLGRGVEPMLLFLEEWPNIAHNIGEDALPLIQYTLHKIHKSPNGNAIARFLDTLPAISIRLPSETLIQQYCETILNYMERSTSSIHGHHPTFASPGLIPLLERAPWLLTQVSVKGLSKWIHYGIANYSHHPERQKKYFSGQLPDAQTVLQRQRQGTLLSDAQPQLEHYIRALWNTPPTPQAPLTTPELELMLVPYSPNEQQDAPQPPYYDEHGYRLPDLYTDLYTDHHTHNATKPHTTTAINRYRMALAHMIAHKLHSQTLIADNLSPTQRMAVETLEDARIDTLILRRYPGMRATALALHPEPQEHACDEQTESCIRHRLTLLSRALLCAACGQPNPYQNPHIQTTLEHFIQAMAHGTSDTQTMQQLALQFTARTRQPSDQYATIHFEHTTVDYRDDNRNLWQYIEYGDEEDSFTPPNQTQQATDTYRLPPRLYPEWNQSSQTYHPDWVSVYEHLHPSGNAHDIDKLLQKHTHTARQIKRILDQLKPQDRTRIRYQTQGNEIDLDIALRAHIDLKSGRTPSERIHMSHRTDGRNIAVLLLIDLSQSLNQTLPKLQCSLLELARESVSLLAWAIDALGDPFAIAGFNSNTRHDIRYSHIKGFNEPFEHTVKARLAATQAAYSTRMGAAMRHAGHYLAQQKTEKKLLLILTDGEPADIDSTTEHLKHDTRMAVHELKQHGIHSHCVSLDPNADAYVHDIFAGHHTVIDQLETLPQKLPQLFISLTR